MFLVRLKVWKQSEHGQSDFLINEFSENCNTIIQILHVINLNKQNNYNCFLLLKVMII